MSTNNTDGPTASEDPSLKIRIELTSSTDARINIDGRDMTFGYNGRSGAWELRCATPDTDMQRTIGGMIASRITDVLVDILQAHLPENPNPCGDAWGTWETLDDETLEEVERRMM